MQIESALLPDWQHLQRTAQAEDCAALSNRTYCPGLHTRGRTLHTVQSSEPSTSRFAPLESSFQLTSVSTHGGLFTFPTLPGLGTLTSHFNWLVGSTRGPESSLIVAHIRKTFKVAASTRFGVPFPFLFLPYPRRTLHSQLFGFVRCLPLPSPLPSSFLVCGRHHFHLTLS